MSATKQELELVIGIDGEVRIQARGGGPTIRADLETLIGALGLAVEGDAATEARVAEAAEVQRVKKAG